MTEFEGLRPIVAPGRVYFESGLGDSLPRNLQEFSLSLFGGTTVMMHPESVVVDVRATEQGPMVVVVGPYPGPDAVKRQFVVVGTGALLPPGRWAYLGALTPPVPEAAYPGAQVYALPGQHVLMMLDDGG